MSARLRTCLTCLLLTLIWAPATAAPLTQSAPLDDATHAVVRIRGCNVQGCNQGVGSGVIIDPSGLILTAHHVTLSNPQDPLSRQLEDFVIEVTESARTAPEARYRARVVAQKSGVDLALLQIYWNEMTSSELDAAELDLPYLALADPGSVAPLEELSILGYPLAGGRSINYVREDLSGFDEEGSLLKVQASLGEGNSGGPALVQRDGAYQIAGIVIERRGTLGEVGLIRSIGDLHDLDWASVGKRAVVSSVDLALAPGDDGVLPVVQIDLRLFDLVGDRLHLLAYAFEGATLAPFRPASRQVHSTASGQMVLSAELHVQSVVDRQGDRVIEFAAIPADVQVDGLAFRLALWDVERGRLLWSDAQWRLPQAPLVAAVSTATDTPTPRASNTPTAAPTAMPTAAPTATPTPPAPTPTPIAPTPVRQVVNALGKVLPTDAAPLEQQVLVYPYDSVTSFTSIDFYEQVYQRGGAITDLLSDSLIRLDKNFDLQPGAATDWSVAESGLTWIFALDPNLMWNDGSPVTARDWVATFQYAADPNHAWDFTWYFNGVIKNWDKAVAGEIPLTAIGVTAVDDYTLQFETEAPAPYLPAMLVYSTALSERALTEYGPSYNSSAATSVSSGPYILTEWSKDQYLIYEINPDYKGTNIPFIQKVIVQGVRGDALIAAYQNNDIDIVPAEQMRPADIQTIESDPVLRSQFHPNYGDFRTHYFFFDNQSPPFNDVRVRRAFAHVLDRDALMATLIKRDGKVATSFLMPGFPDASAAALAGIQSYDPDLARLLLAEAGYPNGEGIPRLTLKLRSETPLNQSIAETYAAALGRELGIHVTVENLDFQTYMVQLLARPTEIQFGMISYGMDYLDAGAMLGLFSTGGRHNWNNSEFDDLVAQATSLTGNQAERTRMFQDAERLLVEDVGGVFVYHSTPGDLYKPYLKGEGLEPDANGVAAWHWPGFSGFGDLLSTLYVSNDVSEHRSPPQ